MERDIQQEVPTTYNILFVCTGNTCRSPMAAMAARAELERRGWKNVAVRSAGVAAHAGSPASPGAVEASRDRGLALADHQATRLDRELLDWADLVLGMGPSHLAAIEVLGGGRKAALLGDFAAGREGEGSAVPDPFGGDLEDYRETLDELERLIVHTLDRLVPILQP